MFATFPDEEDGAKALNDLMLAVARDRDRAAFATLFGHFGPRLKAYLLRLGADSGTAEELVQEVMLMVWRRADSFDPALAGAGTWIFTIARNKRIDTLRRERRPEYDPDDPALAPEPDVAADHRIEASQQSERLRRAIALLPDEQADLLRQAYFEDKPHSTIAAERGLALGTVKSRLRLALGRLRKELKESP
jgi:RNA polymerase sigma factor (sigma-70 family)